jgi:hypothetical protein
VLRYAAWLPRVGNLIWIDWCFTVSLFRDVSPGADGLMIDCVTAVWVAGTDMDCLVVYCFAVL